MNSKNVFNIKNIDNLIDYKLAQKDSVNILISYIDQLISIYSQSITEDDQNVLNNLKYLSQQILIRYGNTSNRLYDNKNLLYNMLGCNGDDIGLYVVTSDSTSFLGTATEIENNVNHQLIIEYSNGTQDNPVNVLPSDNSASKIANLFTTKSTLSYNKVSIRFIPINNGNLISLDMKVGDIPYFVHIGQNYHVFNNLNMLVQNIRNAFPYLIVTSETDNSTYSQINIENLIIGDNIIFTNFRCQNASGPMNRRLIVQINGENNDNPLGEPDIEIILNNSNINTRIIYVRGNYKVYDNRPFTMIRYSEPSNSTYIYMNERTEAIRIDIGSDDLVYINHLCLCIDGQTRIAFKTVIICGCRNKETIYVEYYESFYCFIQRLSNNIDFVFTMIDIAKRENFIQTVIGIKNLLSQYITIIDHTISLYNNMKLEYTIS